MNKSIAPIGRFVIFVAVTPAEQDNFELIMADDHIAVKFCEKVKAYEVICTSPEERAKFRDLISEAAQQADMEIKMTNYTLPAKYFDKPNPKSLAKSRKSKGKNAQAIQVV